MERSPASLRGIKVWGWAIVILLALTAFCLPCLPCPPEAHSPGGTRGDWWTCMGTERMTPVEWLSCKIRF